MIQFIDQEKSGKDVCVYVCACVCVCVCVYEREKSLQDMLMYETV